jgi:hypothetical protein
MTYGFVSDKEEVPGSSPGRHTSETIKSQVNLGQNKASGRPLGALCSARLPIDSELQNTC